jgi:guanine deaminase
LRLSIHTIMSSQLKPTVFYGSIINPQSLSNYRASRSLLAVSASGTIEWIVENIADTQIENSADSRITDIISQKGLSDVEVVMLKHGEFLMPGFVDTHTVRP